MDRASKEMLSINSIKKLEYESIHLFRDVVAECRKPVFLYSIGKDSSVMLHLARKAFYPAPPPFPLLHIASTWDFADMISHRDRTARELSMDLIVHTNDAAVAEGISPLTTPVIDYTRAILTDALKGALDEHGFDAAFGGGRRDEERSRAKERMISIRSPGHRWDPRNQRPELWNTFNLRLAPGETLRAFPLSNWTELDIWTYILSENISIVPLYFAKHRPVVTRGGKLIVVDDGRLPLLPNEVPEMKRVRFRTLGCYPLSAAMESNATTAAEVIEELQTARFSERDGRLIDGDDEASMEAKKREGYF